MLIIGYGFMDTTKTAGNRCKSRPGGPHLYSSISIAMIKYQVQDDLLEEDFIWLMLPEGLQSIMVRGMVKGAEI